MELLSFLILAAFWKLGIMLFMELALFPEPFSDFDMLALMEFSSFVMLFVFPAAVICSRRIFSELLTFSDSITLSGLAGFFVISSESLKSLEVFL